MFKKIYPTADEAVKNIMFYLDQPKIHDYVKNFPDELKREITYKLGKSIKKPKNLNDDVHCLCC